jgi:uncharacterized protein (TIGR02145 family)
LFEGLFAQAAVTPLSVDYDRQQVTFRVAWSGTPVNNRIWVWVDFCRVAGTSPGTFAKAVISGATATAGSIDPASLNGRGFYVTANPSTITATLSNATGHFNWCAYGSDYPPNVILEKGIYTFKGTTNFIVSSHAQPVTTNTIAKASLTVNSSTTFTDATGCPGIGSLYCPYTGNDLYMDATHLCQQRTSGAQNWEAWIKDIRDDEMYRIVLMPDNKWWLAQNVKYAGVGSAISGCTKDECGRAYTWAQVYASYLGGSSGSTGTVQGICPPGWLLPTLNTYNTLASTFGSYANACRFLRAVKSACSPHDNDYGFSNIYMVNNGMIATNGEGFYTNDEGREDGVLLDVAPSGALGCGTWLVGDPPESTAKATVRCYRQL